MAEYAEYTQHSHGQHGMHTHTAEEYATHQQPIENERFHTEPLSMSDVKDVRLTTTRELLLELRTRAQNWAGHGTGVLADRVDDLLGDLPPYVLDGTREP